MSDRWPERDWFEKAGQDLELARRALGSETPLPGSEVLKTLPVVSIDCAFPDRSIFDNAIKWLNENLNNIIEPERKEAGNG